MTKILSILIVWKYVLFHFAQTSYLSQVSQVIYVEKKFPCGEFSAFHVWRLQGNKKILYMWRNFRCLPMTDVEKSEILHIWHVCDVENVAIYAKFMLFSWKKSVLSKNELCREIRFVVIYALLCGEKSKCVLLVSLTTSWQNCNLTKD